MHGPKHKQLTYRAGGMLPLIPYFCILDVFTAVLASAAIAGGSPRLPGLHASLPDWLPQARMSLVRHPDSPDRDACRCPLLCHCLGSQPCFSSRRTRSRRLGCRWRGGAFSSFRRGRVMPWDFLILV
ncbi:hypothetical protein MRB53_041455 [Persea americana]|nr:hypothetical protein MRB53_041455 [Persea americana]